MQRLIIALCLVLAGTVATAQADDTKVAGITITEIWARATPKSARNGAVYLTMQNAGARDRLVNASTTVARSAEIHESSMRNGIMHMQRVSGIDVPNGAVTKLAPGGFHIMLMGLEKTLKQGDTFELKLQFAKAGMVTIPVTARKVGASTMSHGQSHDMKNDMKTDMMKEMQKGMKKTQ